MAKSKALRPALPSSLDLRFSAAEKFFAGKTSYLKADFLALREEAQVYAFTVARITSMQLLNDIRAEVSRAIVTGSTLADFQKSMPGLMAKHGWAGTTPWHVETIFRTNVQMAYGMGQLADLRKLTEAFPFWQYSAINDHRVRLTHYMLNGKIYPANHSFWRLHFPPWEFNCRCDVIPLLPEQVGDQEVHTDAGPAQASQFSGPGQTIEVLKRSEPIQIANQIMPRRFPPKAQAELLEKLAEPVPPVPAIEGKLIEEAWLENAKRDKVAAIAKLEKEAAEKAAAIAAAKKKYPNVAENIGESFENFWALAKDEQEKVVELEKVLAAKKAKAAVEKLKKKYPNLAEKAAEGGGSFEAIVEGETDEFLSGIEKKYADVKAKKLAAEAAAAAKAAEKAAKDAAKKAATEARAVAESLKEAAAAAEAAKAAANAAASHPLLDKKAFEKAANVERRLIRKAKRAGDAAGQAAAEARLEAIKRERDAAVAAAKGTSVRTRAKRRAPGAAALPVGAQIDPLRRLSMLDFVKGRSMGVGLRRDDVAIEGHALNVRRIQTKDGELFYEFNGKMNSDDLAEMARTSPEWKAVGQRQFFRSKDVNASTFVEEGDAQVAGVGGERALRLRVKHGMAELRIDNNRWNTEIESTGGSTQSDVSAASSRSFRIRIPISGNDLDDFDALEKIVRGNPLKEILKPATAEASRKVGILRALRDQFPKLMYTESDVRRRGRAYSGGNRGSALVIDGTTRQVSISELAEMPEDKLMKVAKENLSPAVFNALGTIEENAIDALGYVTHTMKRNFDYDDVLVFHGGSTKPERVADAIFKGRFLSSFERVRAGLAAPFTSEDNATGGADSLFTRLLVRKTAVDRVRIQSHYQAGKYQMVFNSKVLERLDTYAFSSDTFGRATSHAFEHRKSINELVDLMNTPGLDHQYGNEIMFRRGMTIENLEFVSCARSDREALLSALRARGITEVNGKPIELFVKSEGSIVTENWFPKKKKK